MHLLECLNENLIIKQNDTKAVFKLGLSYSDGSKPDLTNANATVYIADELAVVVTKEMVIEDVNGIVSFELNDEDVTGTGILDLEVVINYLDGKKETFPDDGYSRFKVVPNLSKRGETTVIDHYKVMVEQIVEEVLKNVNDVTGVSDYRQLTSKPKINDVELIGNKTSADLGLADSEHKHSIGNISGLENMLSRKANLSTIEENYSPKTHEHSEYITESRLDEMLGDFDFGDLDHTHENLVTNEELNEIINSLDFADSEHTHDEYVTETEMKQAISDAQLGGEDGTPEVYYHTHTTSDITTITTNEDVDTLWGDESVSATEVNLDEFVTEVEMRDMIEEIAGSLEFEIGEHTHAIKDVIGLEDALNERIQSEVNTVSTENMIINGDCAIPTILPFIKEPATFNEGATVSIDRHGLLYFGSNSTKTNYNTSYYCFHNYNGNGKMFAGSNKYTFTAWFRIGGDSVLNGSNIRLVCQWYDSNDDSHETRYSLDDMYGGTFPKNEWFALRQTFEFGELPEYNNAYRYLYIEWDNLAEYSNTFYMDDIQLTVGENELEFRNNPYDVIYGELVNKADLEHTHEEYVTKDEVSGLTGNIDIDNIPISSISAPKNLYDANSPDNIQDANVDSETGAVIDNTMTGATLSHKMKVNVGDTYRVYSPPSASFFVLFYNDSDLMVGMGQTKKNSNTDVVIQEGTSYVRFYDIYCMGIEEATFIRYDEVTRRFEEASNHNHDNLYYRKELIDQTKFVEGYLNSGTGEVEEGNNYKITDFIRVYPNTEYVYVFSNFGDIICFYDENKNFISGSNCMRFTDDYDVYEITIVPPENAYYVRTEASTKSLSHVLSLTFKKDLFEILSNNASEEIDLSNYATKDDLGSKYDKTGGTINGDITLQKFDNGRTDLIKNHSDTMDYGTYLRDVNAEGKSMGIVLQGGQPAPYLIDQDGNTTYLLNKNNAYWEMGLTVTANDINSAVTKVNDGDFDASDLNFLPFKPRNGNLYIKDSADNQLNVGIEPNSGELEATEGYELSHRIDLKAGFSYSIDFKLRSYLMCAMYDVNGVFINSFYYNNSTSTNFKIKNVQNKGYILIELRTSDDSKNDLIVTEINTLTLKSDIDHVHLEYLDEDEITDFNKLVKNGTYWFYMPDEVLNAPSDLSNATFATYCLEVKDFDLGWYGTQVLTNTLGEMWIRGNECEEWSEWKNITKGANVDVNAISNDIIGKLYDETNAGAIQIGGTREEPFDLNNLTECGSYFGHGDYLLNAPSDTSGMLEIKKLYHESDKAEYVIQIWTDRYNKQWKRRKGSSDWYEWYEDITAENFDDYIEIHETHTKHLEKIIYTATIPSSGWISEPAGNSNYATVTGIIESDTPIISPVYTGVLATDKLISEAWNKINRIITEDDGILIYCFDELPEVEIPIQIEVIR